MITDGVLGLLRKISLWINILYILISLLSSIELAESRIEKFKSFFWYWYSVTPTDRDAINNEYIYPK